MTEKLHGSFGLQPALDALEGQGRDAKGELGLGDARLHAERLGHARAPADRPASGTSSSRMSPNA